MNLDNLPVSVMLKAVALIQNRLGEPDLDDDRNFAFLLEGDSPADMVVILGILSSITAIILEGLDEIYLGVTGQPWPEDLNTEVVAVEILDSLREVFVDQAVTDGAPT